MVVITPLQAGKRAAEAAEAQEGDNYGVYESPAAVDWYTQAAQDMDYIIGLWHAGDTCLNVTPKQMIVYSVKHRADMRVMPHRLQIDPKTALLYDMTSTNRDLDPGHGIVSSKETNEALNTTVTTSIDMENWPL